MRIQTNVAALNSWRSLNQTQGTMSKHLERLSSGMRINRAADDAAGLAISEKMRAQIRGLNQAVRNAQDGISLIQTAEGGLSEVHSILQRVRELADQSANGTNTDVDRTSLQDEVKQLMEEIDRIGNTTEFNTMKLLNGNLRAAGASGVIGSKVFGDVAAKATGGEFIKTDYSSALDFDADETIVVDGHTISIDWASRLTGAERLLLQGNYDDTASGTNMNAAQQDAVVAAFNRVINESIDAYNAGSSSGTQVSHVKVTVDTGQLVIESGTKGEQSSIRVNAASASEVLGTYFGAGAAEGYSEVLTAVDGKSLQFQVNGVTLKTGAIGAPGDTTANALAAEIQTVMQAAIDAYHTASGLAEGDDGYIQPVSVNVQEGRLVVSSGSGVVSFRELEGETTVASLGLLDTGVTSEEGMIFQIGANRGQTMSFSIKDVRTAALGIASTSVATAADASLTLDSLDKAITAVSGERSKLGALQNRLDHTVTNLQVSSENLTAAESRVRDADMAQEMMEFTKNQILLQAGTAMLAQANQSPQQVLQLLR